MVVNMIQLKLSITTMVNLSSLLVFLDQHRLDNIRTNEPVSNLILPKTV